MLQNKLKRGSIFFSFKGNSKKQSIFNTLKFIFTIIIIYEKVNKLNVWLKKYKFKNSLNIVSCIEQLFTF